MTFDEYNIAMLKFWQAEQEWNLRTWEAMKACPWLFYPTHPYPVSPYDPPKAR